MTSAQGEVTIAPQFILTISAPNQPGIVSRVTRVIFENGGDIKEANQFDDAESNRFFGRIVFTLPSDATRAAFSSELATQAEALDLDWSMRSSAERRKVLILVSKFDHCLVDLLYRVRIGELPMTVVGIVSNHPRETFDGIGFGEIPFHHLPITKDTKPQQEAQIRAVVEDAGTELVILARYMQIFSDEMAAYLSGRCINIHHSFLPGFKGAKPYHQAHARGVKLIGATAHFVTEDLDEGPIIEQDVERISHNDTTDILVRKGRDIERRVLSQAVSFYLEDRVLVNRTRTVVFRA